MKITLLNLIYLVLCTKAFNLFVPSASYLTRAEIDDVIPALNRDNFFKKLQYVGDFSAGKDGNICRYNESGIVGTGHDIAVSISNDHSIDIIPVTIDESHLELDGFTLSNRYNSLRFINYLRTNQVGFIVKPLTDRNIILCNQKNKKTAIKNVWAHDIGGHGNLLEYSLRIKNEDEAENIKFALDIMYKVIYAFKNVNEKEIMHGDISFNNIFIRDCSIFSECNVFPVITGWDLAHYYKTNVQKIMPYSNSYRPPEVDFYNTGEFFQDKATIFIGNGGYKYSKTEDTFALGVLFIHLFDRLNLLNSIITEDCHQYLKNLLLSMISPLQVEEVLRGIKLNNDKSLNPSTQDIITNISFSPIPIRPRNQIQNFDQITTINHYKAYIYYKYYRNKLTDIYEEHIDKIHTCLNKIHQNDNIIPGYLELLFKANNNPQNPAFMYLQIKKLAAINKNGIILQTMLNECDVNTSLDYINANNPYHEAISSRITLETAFNNVKEFLQSYNIANGVININEYLDGFKMYNEIEMQNQPSDRNTVLLANSYLNNHQTCGTLVCDYLPFNTKNTIIDNVRNYLRTTSEIPMFELKDDTLEKICETTLIMESMTKNINPQIKLPLKKKLNIDKNT